MPMGSTDISDPHPKVAGMVEVWKSLRSSRTNCHLILGNGPLAAIHALNQRLYAILCLP